MPWFRSSIADIAMAMGKGNGYSDFIKKDQDALVVLHFRLEETRKVIERGRLACETSRWLIDRIEAQSQPLPED